MFTGLVQGIGTIVSRSGNELAIRPGFDLPAPQYGESIAVNGCCLTLEKFSGGILIFHTMQESLRRTNLGSLSCGSAVNLERALRLGDPLGGHIVQGHVDTAAEVISYRKLPDGDYQMEMFLAEEFAPLVVEKGGIAVDGVSLTVAAVKDESFSVKLIPVTRNDTALAERNPGMKVNLEFDVIGRYILRLDQLRNGGDKKSGITMDTLREAGFL